MQIVLYSSCCCCFSLLIALEVVSTCFPSLLLFHFALFSFWLVVFFLLWFCAKCSFFFLFLLLLLFIVLWFFLVLGSFCFSLFMCFLLFWRFATTTTTTARTTKRSNKKPSEHESWILSKNAVKIGVSVCSFFGGGGGDVKNKGHEKLGVKILAGHLSRRQKMSEKRPQDTAKTKGFAAYGVFCKLWVLRSKAFFQKNMLVAKQGGARSYGCEVFFRGGLLGNRVQNSFLNTVKIGVSHFFGDPMCPQKFTQNVDVKIVAVVHVKILLQWE